LFQKQNIFENKLKNGYKNKMRKQSTYLRSYPVEWPLFSVKNYEKDVDGWWNWCPKERIRKKNDIRELLVDDKTGLKMVSSNVNDESGNFRSSRDE